MSRVLSAQLAAKCIILSFLYIKASILNFYIITDGKKPEKQILSLFEGHI